MAWKPETPRPKRRLTREEKKQQTRESILESARALFAAKGMEATTIDEIAAAAGYSRGAFYANFDNKDDLIRSLVGEGFSGDTAALEAFAQAGDSSELAEAYQEYGRRFTDHPESLLWALEFQLAALRHPELREEYNLHSRTLRSEVARLLVSALGKTRSVEEAQVRSLAEALVSLQVSLSVQGLLDPDRLPRNSFKRVFEVILRGAAVVADGADGGKGGAED